MQTEKLKLIAVSNEDAANEVVRILKGVDGVSSTTVSLARNEATVVFDEKIASVKKIQSALLDSGYGINVAEATHGKNGSCCGSCGG